MKCFKKIVLKVSVYPKSSILENLYSDHKFLRSVTYGIFLYNRIWNTSQERIEYVLKTYWRNVNKNNLTW